MLQNELQLRNVDVQEGLEDDTGKVEREESGGGSKVVQYECINPSHKSRKVEP